MTSTAARISWRAYFRTFCEQHGGYPLTVEDGTRLLFSDGWQYSSTSWKGPEYPPPDDGAERAALVRTYWGLRKSAVSITLAEVSEKLRAMEALQGSRSAPLQQRTVHRDPATGKRTVTTEPVNLDELRGRVEWLRADLLLSEERLA